jgi:hypothetical protein
MDDSTLVIPKWGVLEVGQSADVAIFTKMPIVAESHSIDRKRCLNVVQMPAATCNSCLRVRGMHSNFLHDRQPVCADSGLVRL